jgi:hydroxymethylpyrimidine/phosphomethylpyrimidine kinase
VTRPTALTIAGSDPGGGAGIQADLKTFQAFGVFGTAAIAALTAQDTRGVHGVHPVPPAFVAAQVDAVLGDIGADAVKTGMLASAPLVEAVAARLRAHRVERLVVDPVMVAKGGARLLEPDAVGALERLLLPLALIVTPNAAEAEALAGIPVRDLAGMREAARRIRDMGPRAVLVKGGHVEETGALVVDLLLDEGGALHEMRGPRLDARHTHGTGCALSAAIAALLARGRPLAAAVDEARRWLALALARGAVPGRGAGHGCPDHFTAPP